MACGPLRLGMKCPACTVTGRSSYRFGEALRVSPPCTRSFRIIQAAEVGCSWNRQGRFTVEAQPLDD
jgi:hypothetical protein